MISIEEHRNGEIMKEHSNGTFLDNFACQKTLFSSFIASASMHEEKIKKIDWEKVNFQLLKEQNKSISWLKNSLE